MNYLWAMRFLFSITVKWTAGYFLRCLKGTGKPTHIIFCMVDHYEPGTQNATPSLARERVDLLLSKYPALASKHRDSAGNLPTRTWFYPPHYHTNYYLRDLVSLCEKGYGEIELHLHHGKTEPDTSENLIQTINQCIEEYSQFGIFGSINGRKRYGFIHGDWALDNSRHGKYCGVNDEIQILNQTGCYADFTFPSENEANPSQINSIYYAQDKPTEPKSYNTGTTVKRFGKGQGDLMIVQGPLYPFFKRKRFDALRVFGSGITGKPPVTNARIDTWIKTGIHVKGRRDWIILKMHTHGAMDSEAVLGKEMDHIFGYLENKYNNGTDYVLHYVTARELYNIIKASEAGEPETNPDLYRNYMIKPPVYNSSPDIGEASEKLKELVGKTYQG